MLDKVRKPKATGPVGGGLEIGHRRASKSSTDAQGFSYPDVRFQAIKWGIISDRWY